MKTKLRALYDCRNHWQWLEITGSIDKDSYEPSEQWRFNCACCESMGHDSQGFNINDDYVCNDCPLTGYAWDRCASQNRAPCDVFDTNSYYYGWRMAKAVGEVRCYAHKMVMACNRAIEDILCKS